MDLTRDILRKSLKELRKQQQKYSVNKRYYDGQHDIIYKYAEQDQRSNQKVVVNFFKKFIQDEVSYSLGNPISYISKSQNEEVLEEIDSNFSHWQKRHDQLLAIKTATYGFAFELDYVDEDGEFKSTVLTPLNCFAIESGRADQSIQLALHNYKISQFSETEMLDVYHSNKIYTYKLSKNDAMSLVGEREHIFEKPPIRVNAYNEERQSLLVDIKSENDAYNNTLSDLVNEVSDFRQAFLRITGAELDEDEAKKMKKNGIIQISSQAQIDFLTKEINDTFVQNLLSELEEKIYKLSSHIDVNEKISSNVSGVSLRSRMIGLEQKCSLIQTMMESTIKKRLKNFFHYLSIKHGREYNYKDIKTNFTMNIPHDLVNIGDFISKVEKNVSQRTILSLLPFIENPEHELKQFYKEQKEKRNMEMEGQVDLENLGINPEALNGGDNNE
ncbi:phage portal protein [Salsuginibacillus kocurii]|uniref:phage portal protein n=1 Tax=Salsuginibacillus kocurii TaxID=427078 RepID=UPI000381B577|nr:phage portal protein [Salsuginibacillus kocurii]